MDKVEVVLVLLVVLLVLPAIFAVGWIAYIAAQYFTVMVIGMMFHPEWSLVHVASMPFSEVYSIAAQFWYLTAVFFLLFWVIVVAMTRRGD